MYSELLRYSGNRAYAELVLSADLFEHLLLRSPIQRVPTSRADACIRVPIRLEGGPKQNAELDQIRIPKSAMRWSSSSYRTPAPGKLLQVVCSCARREGSRIQPLAV